MLLVMNAMQQGLTQFEVSRIYNNCLRLGWEVRTPNILGMITAACDRSM
jgi:hypothetical protein